MKKVIKYIGLVSIIIFALDNCRPLPNYPIEPSIEYKQVYFRKGDTTNYLTVEISFKDGDGDLGLNPKNPADSKEPYNALYVYKKKNGGILTYADRNTPPYDTIPAYEFPYYCTNYLINNADTLYIQQNPNHFNIFVNFYVKKNGVFTPFDWITWNPPNCGESYNGRFPILNESGQTRPLEGTLKYSMAGLGFEVIFKRDTLRLDIQIQDRALHKSNWVQTQEFVLRDITVN